MTALEATWPAASQSASGPFLHRDGAGGGQRVSATTLTPGYKPDVVLDQIGQMPNPLFRVEQRDARLADLMDRAGLVRHDATLFRVAPVSDIAERPGAAEVFTGWPILEQHRRIWAAGGIGPSRLAVMTRAPAIKSALLGRLGDAPAAAGFVGISGDIAMLHALEVAPDARRNGLGRIVTAAAAHWAQTQGALWFALAVTEANTGANALYAEMGLHVAGGYHYRIRQDEN